jgi:hypothetical protein
VIDERPSELKNTGYEIFIAVLSVLSIVNLVLMYAIADDNLDTVIGAMNILQRRLPRRLRLPAVDCRVEVRVLLPRVRVG